MGRRPDKTMFSRITAFLYGVVCYLAFFATFLYAIGFIGNLVVPKSIDSGPHRPFTYALAVNAALLGLFAVQHSLMARQWFKRAWTRIVPAPVERSTYVLFSSLSLLLMFWKWEPMGRVIWNVESDAGKLVLLTLYATGWLTVLSPRFSSTTSIFSVCARSGSTCVGFRTLHFPSGHHSSIAWFGTLCT